MNNAKKVFFLANIGIVIDIFQVSQSFNTASLILIRYTLFDHHVSVTKILQERMLITQRRIDQFSEKIIIWSGEVIHFASASYDIRTIDTEGEENTTSIFLRCIQL